MAEVGPSFDEPPALGWDVPVDMEPGGKGEADHQSVTTRQIRIGLWWERGRMQSWK